jgi:serine/threonine protein kinase/WD40 repeat protein
MSASPSNSAVVLELAEEFLQRYRQGERPSLKEYVDRRPDLAAEIREVFPAMALMENIALTDESPAGSPLPAETSALTQLGDFRIVREIGRGGMGVVYQAEQLSLGRQVALKVLPATVQVDTRQRRRFEREARAAARLHHTNIVPVFGVGEYHGLSYYVMQFIQGLGLHEVLEELKRLRGAAPPATQPSGPAAAVARSLLTGQFQPAAADAETIDDQPDGADAHEGPTDPGSGARSHAALALPGSGDNSKRSRQATYWHGIAQVGVQVAGALEYAHQQGVLHRDIKPANLLLDTHGTVWVTDFGLAKANDQQDLTHTGDVLGTLRYLPPEAFEGKADRRSDVYALGLTLYELLALRPAFDEKDRHHLIMQVTGAVPPRLDVLNPNIPGDLVTIVHKAIEREAGHRYGTAAELAADLQRFLDDEPIRARRVGVVERLGRWCRRNPLVASLLGAVVLATAVGFAATLWQMGLAWHHEEQSRLNAEQANQNSKEAHMNAAKAERNALEREKQRDEARAANQQLQKTTDKLTALLNAAHLNLIPPAWDSGNIARVLELLQQTTPAAGEADPRGFAWHYWNRQCHGELASSKFLTRGICSSGNGKRAAGWAREGVTLNNAGHYQAFLKVRDNATGKEWVTGAFGPDVFGLPVQLNQDGTRLLIRSCALANDLLYRDRDYDDPPYFVVWDVGNSKELLRIDLPREAQDAHRWLAFSPAGDRVALWSQALSDQRRVAPHGPKVWDVRGGRPPLELQPIDSHGLLALAFSTDGKRLGGVSKGSGPGGARIVIWDAVTGKQLTAAPLKARTDCCRVTFSPHLERLVVTDAQFGYPEGPRTREARIMDSATGKVVRVLPAPQWLPQVVFRADGKRLALYPYSANPSYQNWGNLGPDQPQVTIWDVDTGQLRRTLGGHLSGIDSVAFGDGGNMVWTAARDGTIKVWDATVVDGPLLGPPGAFSMVAISRDGKRIAVRTTRAPFAPQEKVEIKVLDLTGNELLTVQPHKIDSDAHFLEFSPDGTHLLSVVADPDDNRLGDGEVVMLQATDGKVCWEKKVSSFDLPRRSEFGGMIVAGHVWRSSFSADGKRLAVVLPGSTHKAQWVIQVLEVATGKVLASTPPVAERILQPTFSPDGKWLAAPLFLGNPGEYGEGAVQVWDAATGKPQLHAKLPGPMSNDQPFDPDRERLAFDPASQRLAAAVTCRKPGQAQDALKVWDIASGKELLHVALPLPWQITSNVAFSADGKRLALAMEEPGALQTSATTVKVWEAGTGVEQHTLRGHNQPISSVLFLPNNRELVTLGTPRYTIQMAEVKLWDLTTGQALLDLRSAIAQLFVTPDGNRLLGWERVGRDKDAPSYTVQWWDATPLGK